MLKGGHYTEFTTPIRKKYFTHYGRTVYSILSASRDFLIFCISLFFIV